MADGVQLRGSSGAWLVCPPPVNVCACAHARVHACVGGVGGSSSRHQRFLVACRVVGCRRVQDGLNEGAGAPPAEGRIKHSSGLPPSPTTTGVGCRGGPHHAAGCCMQCCISGAPHVSTGATLLAMPGCTVVGSIMAAVQVGTRQAGGSTTRPLHRSELAMAVLLAKMAEAFYLCRCVVGGRGQSACCWAGSPQGPCKCVTCCHGAPPTYGGGYPAPQVRCKGAATPLARRARPSCGLALSWPPARGPPPATLRWPAGVGRGAP